MTPRNGGGASAALMVGLCVALVVTLVVGYLATASMPEVATKHGAGVDRTIRYFVYATGALAVLGHVILGLFIWRYRGSAETPFRRVTRRAEWIWALVPVLAMTLIAEVGGVVLGIPIWTELHSPSPEGTLEVEVLGKQFEWIIRYPGKDGLFGTPVPERVDDAKNPVGLDRKDKAARDDIEVRGTLRLPRGRHVTVRIRSNDVLHSFACPQFRIKQDAVPGFTSWARFVPTRTGEYEITCAELCGLGHYKMRGLIQVMEPADFDAWLGRQIGKYE